MSTCPEFGEGWISRPFLFYEPKCFSKIHKETIFQTIKRIWRAVGNHTSCRLQLCTNLPPNSLLTLLRCVLVRNWKDAGVAVARRVVCYGRVAATAALQLRLRLRCVSVKHSFWDRCLNDGMPRPAILLGTDVIIIIIIIAHSTIITI